MSGALVGLMADEVEGFYPGLRDSRWPVVAPHSRTKPNAEALLDAVQAENETASEGEAMDYAFTVTANKLVLAESANVAALASGAGPVIPSLRTAGGGSGSGGVPAQPVGREAWAFCCASSISKCRRCVMPFAWRWR